MSVIVPDSIPATQVQLPPLPAKSSIANVSISAYQDVGKLTLEYILKKVSKKNDLSWKISYIHPLNHQREELCYIRSVYPGILLETNILLINYTL